MGYSQILCTCVCVYVTLNGALYWVAHYPMGNYVCEQLKTHMRKPLKLPLLSNIFPSCPQTLFWRNYGKSQKENKIIFFLWHHSHLLILKSLNEAVISFFLLYCLFYFYKVSISYCHVLLMKEESRGYRKRIKCNLQSTAREKAFIGFARFSFTMSSLVLF